MSVTLKQIADELNVSQATVTNALNGKPNVSEALRLVIRETALHMGYDKNANRAAQLLIARRHGNPVQHNAIALILQVSRKSPHYSPFYRVLMDGAEDEARKRGFDLYLTHQRDKTLPHIVKERRVDGLIFFDNTKWVREELRTLALPVVTLGAWNPQTYNILPDGEGGTYEATKYLIERGHARIAYVGGSGFIPEKRRQGYRRALAEHGLPFDESLMQYSDRSHMEHAVDKSAGSCVGNNMELYGRAAMRLLLERNRTRCGSQPDFTAVLCQNDVIAIGVVRQAEKEGLAVPDDLSVIGFDDVTPQYNFQPLLTSVAPPYFAMGQHAVAWLCQEAKLRLNKGTEDAGWQQSEAIEYFPTTLAVRDSTRVLTGKEDL